MRSPKIWELGNINARVFYQYNCTDFFSFISSLMLSPTFLLFILGLQTRINLNNKIGLISLNLFSFELTHLFEMPMQLLLRERKLIVEKKKKKLPFRYPFSIFSYRKSKCCLHIFIITFWMNTIWRIFNIS